MSQINELLQYATEATFVVVDFETVTPAGRPPEPMELAAMIVLPGFKVEKASVFNSLMRLPAGVYLTSFDTSQTGIRQEDVDKAKSQNEVFSSFENFLPSKNFIFIAQNANYEASIFFRFKEICPKSSNAIFVDTIKIAKYLIPNLQDYKLDTLARYFKIPIAYNRHRALPDVEMTSQVFHKLMELMVKQRNVTRIKDLFDIGGIPKKYDNPQQSLF